MPPVVKNLIIINVMIFLVPFINPKIHEWMILHLTSWFPLSPHFNPAQPITSMFMHDTATIFHLGFNMLSLWMFGSYLENIIGARRFLIFYLVCGVGACLFNYTVDFVQFWQLSKHVPSEIVYAFRHGGSFPLVSWNAEAAEMSRIFYSYGLGASGAIYGVMAGYAYYNPNARVSFFFLIPLKAKYLVPLMMGVSLYAAIRNDPQDTVGHVVHLGGGLVGFLYLYFGKLRSRMRRF